MIRSPTQVRAGLAALVALLFAANASAQIEQQNVPRQAPPPPKAPQLTKPPELVDYVSPEYPQELFAQGIDGEAVLLIDIDETGHTTNAVVSRVSDPAFVAPALEAARKLTFSPAEIDGKPSPIRIEYRFVFTAAPPEPDVIAGAKENALAREGPVSFRGRVREAVSRKPLPGATVMIDGRPVAVTNDEGRFEVRGAPAGTFEVKIVAQNHRTYFIDEDRRADQLLEGTYYLLPRETNPYETVVTTRAPKREVSKVELKREELSTGAGTFGDPLRVLENLPGMGRAFGGLGGALIVRGANPEDTKVYVDGVEVPFLYHFGGLTSVIQAQFLDHIDFYPGGFGAKYGRSTAGIVDVGTRVLDCDGFHGRAKIDFVDSAYYSCQPLGDGWNFGAALRRSYIDVFIRAFAHNLNHDPDGGSATIAPVYFDYQTKLTKTFGRNTFEIFLFGSSDNLSFVQTGSLENVNFNFGFDQYFNRTMLRHRYKFSDKASLSSQVTGGYTRFAFGQKAAEIDVDNRFTVSYPTLEWREQLDVRFNDKAALALGLDHQFGSAKLSITAPLDNRVRTFPTQVFNLADASRLSTSLGNYSQGYWVEAQLDPGAGFKIIPGFRFERVDFAHTQGYEYLPRLNVRWALNDDVTFKAAVGLYEKLPEPQYFLPSAGNPYLGTERATQYITGYEQKFSEAINLDIQGFYTDRTHLRQDSSAVVATANGVRSEVYDNGGRGHTAGMQLLLRHNLLPNSHFFGWVSYTLSRSVVTDTNVGFFEGDGNANDGLLRQQRNSRTYLSNFDQTHILTVVGQWTLPKNWQAGFRFRLTSGNPYTPLNLGRTGFDADRGTYFVNTDIVGKNSGRLPAFHQLDIRIDRSWTYSLVRFGFAFEILNVYNHRNTEQYSYDYRFRGVAPLRTIPFLPNFGAWLEW